ncbi:MAG: ABC transporter permease [Candidatus Aminicenantes bacterium]|nr:ABC transporter permease [Candidatus Aminicenantes bacterium]
MPDKKPSLSPFLLKTLQIVVSKRYREAISGDLIEMVRGISRKKGTAYAKWWAVFIILTSFPRFLSHSFRWSLEMFKSILKLTLRHLKRHKGFSFINIAGLTIGITASLLMFLWVQDELSFDGFHANEKNIYRVICGKSNPSSPQGAVSPPVLAKRMKSDFPEVVETARLYHSGGILFSRGEASFFENNGLLVDPSFFRIFTFPFTLGDPETAFQESRSIAVSEKLAFKYFGQTNPLNKTITLDTRADFKITGVFKNVPQNSHLRFDYVLPFSLLERSGRDMNSWTDVSYYTYVLLREGASHAAVDKKFEILGSQEDPQKEGYYLQPLKNIYLRSDLLFDIGRHGNRVYVTIFFAAALFILVIACINFMNLATARSGRRAKEVGMRKAVGATRGNLVTQFYFEAFFLSFLALFLALLLVHFLIPVFYSLSGKQLSLGFLNNPFLLLTLAGTALITGVLSGSYPALFLSSFQPQVALKNMFNAGIKGARFRKILVILQFSLTIILITGTMVIYKQLDFMRNKDLGFNKDHIISISMRGEFLNSFSAIKNAVQQNPNILNISAASNMPLHIGSGTSHADWEGKTEDDVIQMQIAWVDADYLDTFEMKMVEGRFFKTGDTVDQNCFVLNEAAVKAMGMDSPLGKRFSAFGKDGHIIGVIKNFHYKSLHSKIEPLILNTDPRMQDLACIRINAKNIPGTLRFLEKTWKEYAPDYPFEYAFLDDEVDALYRAEQRLGKVFNVFTFLAVFIACLGLFGLSSFMSEQRTKEVGIRKVLGAGMFSIVRLLNSEFILLIGISSLFACPASYVVMTVWLQHFSYRIQIPVWIFLVSAGLALGIALLTVSQQSLKAAMSRPVDSIRYE